MTEQTLNPYNPQNESSEVGVLSLHDIIQMVLANWYWFALSVVLCLCIAYYYLASTPKVYSRTAFLQSFSTPCPRRSKSLNYTAPRASLVLPPFYTI